MKIETVQELVTKYIVDGVEFYNRREAEYRMRALNAKKIILGLPTVASKARWYLVRNQTELEAIYLLGSGGGYTGELEPTDFFPAWVHIDVFYNDDPPFGDYWSSRMYDLSVEMLEEMVETI